MCIVLITIPGGAKQALANALHEKTGGKVELVIIQKPKQRSFWGRFRRLYKAVGFAGLPKELWHAAHLRLNRKKRFVLEYFRECTADSSFAGGYGPKTLEVDSVNSDEVHAVLQRLSPELLVVWGSAVLKPHIIRTAKKAINLHMGFCPHYRGAVANQFAVLRGDYSRVGATIHYIDEKVDTGDVIEVIAADHSKSPRDLFRELNDRAQERFLEIALRLFSGEYIPGKAQELSHGETFFLRHWTPETRHMLAKRVLEWERSLVSAPRELYEMKKVESPVSVILNMAEAGEDK